MKAKHFEKWKKRRGMGALRFILLFGLVWAAIFSLLYYLLQVTVPYLTSIRPLTFLFTIDGFLMLLGISIIGGLVWSTAIWVVNESSFKIETDARKTQPTE